MTRAPMLVALLVAALGAGGCSWVTIPGWVPWLGATKESPLPPSAAVSAPPSVADVPAEKILSTPDEAVSDRVVAVVNNDAITLGELQESILLYRQENRERGGPSDDELAKQFLNRLIDTRLQFQEAEREKVTVEEEEVTEEVTERMKKFGATTIEQFAKMVQEQGLSMEAVRKRLRESIATAKIVHRRVRLRVSVTERDIERYLEENREKLEVGLGYHARHILIQPEDGKSEAGWEQAQRRAEGLRAQILAGGDFAELAKAFSRDATASEGGDLGPLKRGELALDIETHILGLKPREVSAPYRSALGWHLFRLESKDTLEGDGLVRARQQIRDILLREKFEARQAAWLKEIKQRAVIELRM